MNKTRIDIHEHLVANPSGHRPLYADLYRPGQADANGNPAVVLVYGGSWRSGERSQQKVYGLALAKAGFVCLAAEHRFSTEAKWPAQLDDVRTAVRWLRAHAREFNIDPERIAISGNSSGGHLALMVAAAGCDSFPLSREEGEWGEFSSQVKAVCAFYPPTKLDGLDNDNHDDSVRALLGAGAARADYERASPLTFATQPFPPVVLLSGSDDQRVPVEQTYQLHQALEQTGNTVEMHVFAGQGHAFDADRDMARVSATVIVNFFQRYV